MPFDDNTFNTTIATAVSDSFNDDNSENYDLDVDVADSFNEDNSVNDNDAITVGIEDSFKNDSDNTSIDVDDSGNTDSYNDTWEFTDASETDNSINAGVRSYNLGFDGFGGGAAAGAVHGDVMINNQNTVVDQSASNNIAAFGPVFQASANEAVVASGDDSLAAGDDISVVTEVDQSTDIDAGGDVLIDSTKTESFMFNSGNTYDFDYTYEDHSIEVDVEDSWNDYTLEVDVTDSFNDESLAFDYTEVDVNVDAIVASEGAAIVDDIDLGF